MTTPSPLAQAIANAEGYGTANAPTITENNNPGALFANGVPQSFATQQDGWQALQTQIDMWLSGSSQYANIDTPISQLAQTYTGGDSPDTWGNNVASFMGVSPNTTLGQLQSMGLASYQTPKQTSKLSQWWNKLKTGAQSDYKPSDTFTGDIGKSLVKAVLTTPVAFFLIGGLLIFGGVMGFDKMKDTIIETGKTVAKGAEIAE